MNRTRRAVIGAVTAVALVGVGTPAAIAATAAPAHHGWHPSPVGLRIVTPTDGANAGSGGKGWMVDLVATFPTLKSSGFTGPQLTGPGAHDETAPFPGTFSPGADDHFPGLVVLSSTTTSTAAGFSGPGTNLANLFNITSLIDSQKHFVRIQDSWIVGAPILGVDRNTTLTIAIVKDLNHDGVYDDAPAVVADANHDGRIDAADLRALGVVGPIETVHLHLSE